MFGFGEKKKSISRHDAMAARPLQMVKCDLEPMPNGGAKLKVPLRQGGFVGKVFRVPEGATKTFELDSLGLFVWENCDGKTSVQQIIRRLAKEHQLTQREVEVATIRFLQMLVRKGLVGMSIEQKTKEDAK
jgi:hypothetical protein